MGSYKNIILEQKLMEQITKIKIINEKTNVSNNNNNNNSNNKNNNNNNENNNNNNDNKRTLRCSILTNMHSPWLLYLENWSIQSVGFQNILYTCTKN